MACQGFVHRLLEFLSLEEGLGCLVWACQGFVHRLLEFLS